MNTKVVPVNYIDELEEASMENRDSNYVGIEEMSITYTQPADTNSSSDEVQTLTITSRTAASAGFDNMEKQDGFYFDITISDGQHWSISEGDELK